MGLSLFLMNWSIKIINLTLFQWVSCCSTLTCFPSNRFRIYLSLILFGFVPSNLISKPLSRQKRKKISAWKYWLNLNVIMTWKKPICCPSLQSRLVHFQLPAGRACLQEISATTEWFDWGWNNRVFFFLRYSAGWRLRGEPAQRGPQRQNSGQHKPRTQNHKGERELLPSCILCWVNLVWCCCKCCNDLINHSGHTVPRVPDWVNRRERENQVGRPGWSHSTAV